MTNRRQSQFNQNNVGTDPITEITLAPSNQQYPNIPQQLKVEKLKNSKTDRALRTIYAVIAVCFAIASIIFWMRFIQFYYRPQMHSDTFFITLTTACTVNILAAFISIIKGLFHIKNK